MSTTLSIAIPHDRQVVLRKVLEWAATDSDFSRIKLDVQTMSLTTADRETWWDVMRACEIWATVIGTKLDERRVAASVSTDLERRLRELPSEPVAEVVGVVDERPRQKSLF